ncbi:MAG: hypothetical protein RIB80_04550 [Rhodospirillales bacterium]
MTAATSLAILAVLAALFLWWRKAGKDAVRAQMADQVLERARERNKTDADVARMSDTDLNDRVYGPPD